MMQGDSTSIVRYEETNQILVTGTVEDISERFSLSTPHLSFFTRDGQTFFLVGGGEVGDIRHLSAKRVRVFGTLEEDPSTITVLGYRVLTEPDGNHFERRKRAA
ncbi:hypothetical protein MRY87_09865 [bacterium]|nr:hypothetical protein [bacterium]